ncbi:unnamed protein product, partial [Iphiclides podalirius]
MKSLVVALCVIGCAFAVVPDPQASILRSDYQHNPEGGYQYIYETENGISAHVDGQIKVLNKDEVAHQVQGSVSYLSPDGQKIETVYTADETGYHPKGDHLPTPPAPIPIPDYILRALEYIAAHPYTEKPYVKKFLIVLAAVALASADVAPSYRTDEANAPIVRSDYEINPEGSYQYAYETANGITGEAQGTIKNPNSEAASLDVRGSFSYTAPDGTPVRLVYQADENGYRAEGDSIPVPPAIPELILRSLQYIADHPPPAEYLKKTQA